LQSGDVAIELYASVGRASHPSDPEAGLGPARRLVLFHARGCVGAVNVADTEARMLPSARILALNRVTRAAGSSIRRRRVLCLSDHLVTIGCGQVVAKMGAEGVRRPTSTA
jgi:hypothetical protein